MVYNVHLGLFEGPLDLLLHLIRRDKINIYDIPISRITREYLSYIEIMQELELEVAGEFFVMAATLMRIKSQMLLPKPQDAEEWEEDPREELVRNLIQYRMFKEAAEKLAAKEEERRLVYPRALKLPVEEQEVHAPEVTTLDLIEAMRGVLKNLEGKALYRIVPDTVTVEQKMETIRKVLSSRSEVLFTELFAGEWTRIEIIVTFFAILEMVRLGEIAARQLEAQGDIWIYKPATSYHESGAIENG